MTGLEIPPDFPLHRITAPISLHYSPVDSFTNPKDIERLIPQLNGTKYLYVQTVDEIKFNHVDWIWGIRANELVYSVILDFFENPRDNWMHWMMNEHNNYFPTPVYEMFHQKSDPTIFWINIDTKLFLTISKIILLFITLNNTVSPERVFNFVARKMIVLYFCIVLFSILAKARAMKPTNSSNLRNCVPVSIHFIRFKEFSILISKKTFVYFENHTFLSSTNKFENTERRIVQQLSCCYLLQ